MDVATWLREMGLERYAQAFRDHDVDAALLRNLTSEDLKDIGVTSVGHRRRLLDAIAALQAPAPTPHPTPRSEAERRQLTVMFVDLVGSTALAARLDPEDMGQVIRAYQERSAAVIEGWDGHVAKYMGDGVLAYFGWPRAHEDDAERAVRAGLELVEAVGRLGGAKAEPNVAAEREDCWVALRSTQPTDGTPLAARAGIATGVVMVGDLVGEGAAKERTVVGETPNLAARLQALAAPGAVVIAPTTRRLLGDRFELSDLGARQLKGFAEPVRAWQVAGEGDAAGRFEALHTAALTPLVGRDEELQLLRSRWRRAKDGEGQAVLLAGEPGIGKSRLTQSLLDDVADETHVNLRCFCSPYHTNSALHPVIAQLERAAGFTANDTPGVKLDKLEAALDPADSEAAALLAALLSVPSDGRYPPLDLTPQAQKARTFEAVLARLEGVAGHQPVLMLLEDAHWIDPTTSELLTLAIDRIQRLPVLLVITARPQFTPPWTGHAHLTALTLSRLGQRQGAAMVARLTGGKPLPAEVMEQILAKTDGVPLFVEELTKTVLESGRLRDAGDHYELAGPLTSLAIPATLHDSLMARLDRLAPVKEIAQIGAVIGRDFPHDLLAAISPLPEDQLSQALDQLVAAELVFRRGTPPNATYTFKHALVQDAAYQSLLKSKRRQLHALIAGAIEERFPETAAAEPSLLAQHYASAELVEPAIAYWEQAGEHAIQRSANAEAIGHLSNALDLMETLPATTERARRELAVQIRLAPVLVTIKGYTAPEVETAYTRARELCQRVGDGQQLLKVLRGLMVIHLLGAKHDSAHELAQQMLALAEREQSSAGRLDAHGLLGQSYFYLGRFSPARAHLEEAVRLYDPEQHGPGALGTGADLGVACRCYASWTSWFLGYPEQALAKAHEALALARQSAHPHTLALALGNTTQFHQLRGEIEPTFEVGEALIALSIEQGFGYWPAIAKAMRGWALAERGQGQAAIAELRRGIAAARAIGTIAELPWYLTLLAGAQGGVGRIADGLDSVAEALALVARTNERFYEAEIYRVRGELLLRQDRSETVAEAEVCFRRALDIADRQGAKSWELRAATSLARLWGDQGKRVEARELLAPIYDWFTEGFETPDLKDAKALLDQLWDYAARRP